MGNTRYKHVIFVFAALGLAKPASAEVPPLLPLNINAEYTIAWNGISIGRIKLTATEDQFGYKMIVDTKSGGIARLVSDEASVAVAQGHVGEGSRYIPASFESRPQGNSKNPRIMLKYDPAGKQISRERVPEDDPAWRPPVSAEEASTATDPMTAGFRLRQMMHDNMAKNEPDSMVKTYDGARLAEMHFKVISPARVEVMGQYIDAINSVVTRTPIAGYTPKELKKYKAGDPVIHLYFSADAKFLPVKATVAAMFGELSATLTEVK